MLIDETASLVFMDKAFKYFALPPIRHFGI